MAGKRRWRGLGGLPLWMLGAVGLLAVVAGLVAVPMLGPWSRAPAQSPLDEGPGVGVIGTGDTSAGSTEDTPGSGPGPSSATGPGATVSSGSPSSGAPTTTPAGTTTTAAPTTPEGVVEISFFSATPLPLALVGYEVTVELINRGSGPQAWQSVGVHVNGGLSLSMKVEKPAREVRVFAASGRACLVPMGPQTASLEPGETLTIVLRIESLLSGAPGPARLNDAQGCASADS